MLFLWVSAGGLLQLGLGEGKTGLVQVASVAKDGARAVHAKLMRNLSVVGRVVGSTVGTVCVGH